MNIREAARRSNASVRAMRYYEEVGLIAPDREENGYRDYDEAVVHRVRLIRAYRELQFSLEEIRGLLTAPRTGRNEMLQRQIDALEAKRQSIDNRIALAHSILLLGPERLADIDFSTLDAQLEQSRRSIDQSEALRALSERMKRESKEKTDAMMEELLNCMAGIANAPEAGVSAAIRTLRDCIERYFYPCTTQILTAYARAYGGDGILAQAVEEKAGPGAAGRLRERLERCADE